MSACPSTSESNTIQFPSGHQRGEPAPGPLKLVSCRGPSPFRPATQISLDPDRLDANVICDPSGEKSGTASVSVNVVSLAGAGRDGSVPADHILPPPEWRENTRCLPSGETAGNEIPSPSEAKTTGFE